MDITEENAGKSCQMARFLQDVQNSLNEEHSKSVKLNKVGKTKKKSDQKKKKRKKPIKLPDFENNRGIFENVMVGKTFCRRTYSPLQKARMNEDIFGLAKNKAEEDITIINQEIQKHAQQLENSPIVQVPLLSDIMRLENEDEEKLPEQNCQIEKPIFQPIEEIPKEKLQSQESLKRPLEESPLYNRYDFMEPSSSSESDFPIKRNDFYFQNYLKNRNKIPTQIANHTSSSKKFKIASSPCFKLDYQPQISRSEARKKRRMRFLNERKEKADVSKTPTFQPLEKIPKENLESQESRKRQLQESPLYNRYDFMEPSSSSESDFPIKRNDFYFQNYLKNRNKIPTQIANHTSSSKKFKIASSPCFKLGDQPQISRSEARKRRMRLSPHLY